MIDSEEAQDENGCVREGPCRKVVTNIADSPISNKRAGIKCVQEDAGL